MKNKIRLKVISPIRTVYDGDADIVIMRTMLGDLGVLKGHENLSAVLDQGVLKIVNDDIEGKIAVLGGFAEVTKKGVTVFSDSAENENEIDLKRAEDSKKRAEKRLSENKADLDIKRAEISLKKSIIRLSLVKK